MAASNDINKESVRAWRKKNGLTQDEFGGLVGLKKIAVTKIELGQRGISECEKKVFRLLMHGELPFSNAEIEARSSILQFNELEWEIIQGAALKEGYGDAKLWIVDKIRGYLRMYPETAAAQMVAEQPPEYKTKH
ncbi:MAG: helix-turn-helix transcriptional regulator [Verrucomicrobiota bacterium]